MDFHTYMKQRVKNSSLNLINDIKNEECLVLNDNVINIKNTDITVLNYLDYGATSMIFKARNKKNNNEYVLKIMALSQNEIDIMKTTTALVKNNITPHLMVLYKHLSCVENDNKSDFENLKDTEIDTGIPSGLDYLADTDRYLKDNKYSMLIMELFDDNLLNLLFNNNDHGLNRDTSLGMHIDAQVFLSIMTFHDKVQKFHKDVQYKNFFYKRIYVRPDIEQFFHYRVFDIDVYVKNIGYLVVLADYGFSDSVGNQDTLLEDFFIFDKYRENEGGIKTERDLFLYLLQTTNMFRTGIFPNPDQIINNEPYLIFSSENKKRKNVSPINKSVSSPSPMTKRTYRTRSSVLRS